MAFVLVEFDELSGGGVAVVSKEWLTPRKCQVYWPPTRDQKQFNRLIKETDGFASPPPGWKIYGIRRCLYETDDFEKVNSKLKDSLYTSDLASESELGSRKRRRFRSKRILCTDSEDEDDDNSVLPRPPNLKYLKKPEHCALSDGKHPSLLKDIVQQETSHGSVTSYNLVPESQGVCSQSVSTASVLSTPSSSRMNLDYDALNSEGFHKKLISKLVKIESQNEKILDFLRNKFSDSSQNLAQVVPVNLPVASQEDLYILENHLAEKENSAHLVKLLSSFGGKDVSSQTYRILKYLLTDCVARNFNFYGKRSDKKAFSDLRLRTCIVDAVKQTSNSTDHEIENFIKS